MRFPFAINEPSVNLAILSNLRDTICDALAEGEPNWDYQFQRLRDVIDIAEAIRDSEEDPDQRGKMQDLVKEIFSRIHDTATLA